MLMFIGALFILSFAVWFTAPQSGLRKATAGIFAPDHAEEAFQGLMSPHANAKQNATDLLLITAFSKKTTAHCYRVAHSGEEIDARLLWNRGSQATNIRQLNNEDMAELRQAISQLPKKSVKPPIERLVVISFRDRSGWTTRSYDSKSPPEALNQIYGIIHRRESILGELFSKWMQENPPATNPAE